MKKVTKWELIDHGIDNAQYFQGCGIALTEFEDIAIGVGDTPKEAFEDALEQLAMSNWDVDTLALEIVKELGEIANSPSVALEEDTQGDSEVNYYLSIRVK